MNNHINENQSKFSFGKIVDTLIRLGFLFLLLMFCFDILKPFTLILIWGTIFAISIYPIFEKLSKMFGGRKVVPAILLTIIMLGVLILPVALLFGSLSEGIHDLRTMYTAGHNIIPPPGAETKSWPAIVQPLVGIWQLASENLGGFIVQYKEQLKGIAEWLIGAFKGFSFGVVQLLASIIISGILLAYADDCESASKKIFIKLASDNGEEFHNLSVVTIRNVVRGIIGVALAQSAIASIGMFAIGVPFAGMWTLLCIILAIAQVGVGPVVIPMAIYMFTVKDTLPASLFAACMLVAVISDNILKPLLLGRGSPVPMLVVFLGAIGGFIYSGFLGLFLGAVILSLGYKLLLRWMEANE